MSNRHEFRLRSLVCVLLAFSWCQSVSAQELKNGIQFSAPVESIWDFGLNIKSTGNSKSIKATVPIPMDWPEQKIEIIKENRTQNVGKFKSENPTKHTRQFTFSVGQMIPNETETAFIRFKVKKKMILPPKDTKQFSIPKKVDSKTRTFLKPSPYIESTHKRIKEIAKDLKDDALTGWGQAEKNYRWVRENVEYKFDEQIHSCLEALDSKLGDCEELSSLFIAICRAQKIPARAVWIPGHTYPEFFLVDKEGNGHWFPCQAAGAYEFGSMHEEKPILQKGDRFRLPGERKEVRYVRPTLVAKQPQGQIAIEWISRNVEEAASDALKAAVEK